MIGLLNEAPIDERFTDYDDRHFAVYLSLLHAKAKGVPDSEIARAIFGIDAAREPQRAQTAIETHYRRATWLRGSGARFMLLDAEIQALPNTAVSRQV